MTCPFETDQNVFTITGEIEFVNLDKFNNLSPDQQREATDAAKSDLWTCVMRNVGFHDVWARVSAATTGRNVLEVEGKVRATMQNYSLCQHALVVYLRDPLSFKGCCGVIKATESNEGEHQPRAVLGAARLDGMHPDHIKPQTDQHERPRAIDDNNDTASTHRDDAFLSPDKHWQLNNRRSIDNMSWHNSRMITHPDNGYTPEDLLLGVMPSTHRVHSPPGQHHHGHRGHRDHNSETFGRGHIESRHHRSGPHPHSSFVEHHTGSVTRRTYYDDQRRDEEAPPPSRYDHGPAYFHNREPRRSNDGDYYYRDDERRGGERQPQQQQRRDSTFRSMSRGRNGEGAQRRRPQQTPEYSRW